MAPSRVLHSASQLTEMLSGTNIAEGRVDPVENMQVDQNDVFLQAELHHFLTITFWRKPKDKNTPLPAKQNSPESSCAECTLLLLIYSFFVLFCQLQYFHISLEHAHFSFKTGSIHPENSHQTAVPEHR